MDLSNRIGLYWLFPTFQSLNCVDIHKSLVGPILCQRILIYKKNVQRYIHGNNYMTLMAHFTHCNVENSPRGQAASSSLEKSALPCLVSEWPLLCAWPVASVSSEELTISLGSPSNSLSITAFLRMGSLVFCSCVWPDCPRGSLSQAHPIMPNYVWATMLWFGLGEENGECC